MDTLQALTSETRVIHESWYERTAMHSRDQNHGCTLFPRFLSSTKCDIFLVLSRHNVKVQQYMTHLIHYSIHDFWTNMELFHCRSFDLLSQKWTKRRIHSPFFCLKGIHTLWNLVSHFSVKIKHKTFHNVCNVQFHRYTLRNAEKNRPRFKKIPVGILNFGIRHIRPTSPPKI